MAMYRDPFDEFADAPQAPRSAAPPQMGAQPLIQRPRSAPVQTPADAATSQNRAAATAYDPEQARTGIARTNQQIQQGDTRGVNFADENQLRTQFQNRREVVNYSSILPMFQSALRAADNPVGDMQIITAWARTYDPVGSVREGDVAVAEQAQPSVQRAIAQAMTQLDGRGRLPPDVRRNFMNEIRNRASAWGDQYNRSRLNFRGLSSRYGFDPDAVLGPHPGESVQQEEANFLGRPVQNWDGGQGPRPADEVLPEGMLPQPPEGQGPNGGPRARPGETLRFNDEGPDNPFTTEQRQAYDAFWRANPHATQQQLEQWGRAHGRPISNAEGIVRFHNEHGQVAPGETARYGQMDISDARQGSELRSVSPLERADATMRSAANGALLGAPDWAAAGLDTLTGGGNFRDNLHRQHEITGYDWQHYPVESLAGTVAGGSRLPSPRGFLPGLAADTAYSGIAGASQGEGDLGQHLAGAARGLIAGVPLSAGTRGIGIAAAPRRGRLGPLYDEGVNPSLGVRMGGVGNRMEQAFTSVPLAGGAQRGARNEAIDQFQRGAINQALRDIGQELPANVPVGTRAQAHMQEAFNNEFQQIRSQMSFQPDGQWTQDFGGILSNAGATLPSDAANRFRSIVEGRLAARLRSNNGQLSGDLYSRITSEFGKIARDVRRNEPQLADALDDVADAMDDAAARQSGQDVAARLTAARRGYQKSVIVEDAAARRGGDAGTFSPVQFDAAVQRIGGGATRSRAYLRGEAPMQDYAAAGRELGDTVPNSGTPERLLATSGMIGAGLVSKYMLAPWAMSTLLTLPKVRNVVGRAMNPNRAAQAPRLRQGIEALGSAPAITGANANRRRSPPRR